MLRSIGDRIFMLFVITLLFAIRDNIYQLCRCKLRSVVKHTNKQFISNVIITKDIQIYDYHKTNL